MLHVAMLHAPDFLGYDDAIAMAKDHPREVQRGLAIKKAGNEIVRTIGGREIHPVNVRIGGFYRVPSRAEMAPLTDRLTQARDEALDVVRWVAGFDMPDFEQPGEYVALRHPTEYPFNEGRLVSSGGLDIGVRDFEQHFTEEHVAHSNALHGIFTGRGPYLVGPLARYSLNVDRLSPLAQQAARDAKLPPFCRNPFQSIVVRAVEIVYAFDEALRILASYEPPERPYVAALPRAATGYGCTEAPRGILYHRYDLTADGSIAGAAIVPPTSQNQTAIEDDLRRFVERNLELPNDRLTWLCEQTVRNYDPCISCATHALKVHLERED
jgi:coenzyme F420-reducing hydrogenase alpha subunit